MTTRRTHRPLPSCAAPSPGRLAGDGSAASVADLDGTVTISRRLEPTADGADAETLMSVVAVDGDVDIDNAPLLQQALILAIDDRPRTVLDLHGAGFFGAAGVHVLLAAHRHATARGRLFALRGVHGVAETVLNIVGLSQEIPTIG